MRRFVRGGKRQQDFENAIGSPAGVEMNDYAENAEAHTQLDNLASSRVVSPTPNVGSSSPETVGSGGNISADSNFDVQDTLDRASVPPAASTTDPGTPSRLGTMMNSIYKTPQKQQQQQQQQQQAPMSTASSVGPTAQYNDIGFSPDFSAMDKAMSEKSSDAGDYKETFGDQIDALDDLLATPGKVLGDLADTPISPDDDDSVDQELEDLERNNRLLSQELSQVSWYETGIIKEDPSAAKQLFASTPESKKGGEPSSSANVSSDYDQLFSPSPGPQSKFSPTSKTTPSSQKIADSLDDNTPSISNKRQKEADSSDSSFQLPSVFGFRKTPAKQENQLGIGRNPNAKDNVADSDMSASAVSSSPSTTSGSLFQSFANFSAMVGDSLTSPSGKFNQSEESPTSQPSLRGEELLFDGAGSPPRDTSSQQLSTSLQTVSPIRKYQSRGRQPAPPRSYGRGGGGQSIDNFDANTDSIKQPLIHSQQQQHLLPRTPDRQKLDDNLKAQASYPGLPSPVGMASPHVYADNSTDEEDGFYVRVNKNADQSIVSQCTQDIEVQEKQPEENETMTNRQIACLCGFMVIVIVCALLIALFATDMLDDMENDPRPVDRSPNGTIIIDVPTDTSDPTSFPTRRPTPFPTALEPTLEEFDIGYNIRIANGEADSILSSSYTPDLIESMDLLSVGVLDAIQEGKDPSTLYERRRLASLALPSIIVTITEEECPNANDRDRCERIIAGLSLTDDSNIADRFRNTLQQEVSSGGLQFFLQQVNPNSPIFILDPAQNPGITPALPPTAPNSGPGGPTDPATASPTRSPAFQPTPTTPTPGPANPDALPTTSPAFQPTPTTLTPGPANPDESPTRLPAFQPTPMTPTPGPADPDALPSRSPAFQPTPITSTPGPANPDASPTRSPAFQPTPMTPTPIPNPIAQPSPLPPGSTPVTQPTPFSSAKPTLLQTATPMAPPTSRPTSLPSVIPTAPPLFKATPVPTLRSTNSPTMAPNPTLFDILVSKSFDGGDALLDSSSAQHNAFMWLLTNRDIDKYGEEQLVQRYVMAALYFSTDGERWLNKNNWLADVDECEWFSKAGHGACKKGKLENLELDYNNLNGFLPEELGLLSDSLERIVLHGGPDEKLDGSIPTSIGYLTKLRLLFMPNNSMEGGLPSEIGNLSLLQQINLSNSRLQGNLPSEVGLLTSLVTFDVSGNEFSGLPTEIGMMEKVNKMILHNNKFEGPLPSEIGQIRRLAQLEANDNSFDSLPSEIGELVFCETLELQDNKIAGPIPTEIGEMRRLRLLDLGNNLLTGTIPTEFKRLKELKSRLSLASNRIRGSIPSEFGELDKLRIIDLRRNRLSGSVPEDLSGMKKISTIHLDNNDLDGTIPAKLCALYGRTFPEFSADCADFDDSCPCCSTCCVGGQCTCRYEGTPQEYLCFSRTSEIVP
ncbi:unnamed protein product [Cylindrotheca closterium]|uniref:Disease resistance R13L4/SHOC-2-like LRR domain-containing protein n=1 Tax=Cylindrotheca closterium TaxID=2856 RepID=A0AAD2CDU8_9STRA|nr:unnamed protein product [Cylindrotheca closterium]